MSPGDPIIWTDLHLRERRGTFIATYGAKAIIELPAHGARGVELRYVDPKQIRPADTSTPEHS